MRSTQKNIHKERAIPEGCHNICWSAWAARWERRLRMRSWREPSRSCRPRLGAWASSQQRAWHGQLGPTLCPSWELPSLADHFISRRKGSGFKRTPGHAADACTLLPTAPGAGMLAFPSRTWWPAVGRIPPRTQSLTIGRIHESRPRKFYFRDRVLLGRALCCDCALSVFLTLGNPIRARRTWMEPRSALQSVAKGQPTQSWPAADLKS